MVKITDPYERQARLWPALLALCPIVMTLELVCGKTMSVLTNTVMLVTSCGGLYLLTNICRERGKLLEPKLYEAWGGKPTTQLLRHRNSTIEGVTKRRYHSFLANKINVPFPNAEQESADPTSADEIYQSAVRWLLNQTRDTKQFNLLFKENITYGFRRNALGLKPLGIGISLISILWVLLSYGVITCYGKYFINVAALKTLPEIAVVSLSSSILMLLVWTLFFTRASARTAAFTYAETLLRSCDVIDNKK